LEVVGVEDEEGVLVGNDLVGFSVRRGKLLGGEGEIVFRVLFLLKELRGFGVRFIYWVVRLIRKVGKSCGFAPKDFK
jgi:hypothetical protein